MNGREKSDSAEVAVKPANKTGMPAAEQVEPRAGTEGNAIPQSTSRTQGRADASQARDRIRVAARRNSRLLASASNTRGGSRMRESRPYGSERGAFSNGRPLYVASVRQMIISAGPRGKR